VAETILALNAQSVKIQQVATQLGLGDVVDDDASGCDTTNPGSDAGC
jgi:putative iron-regulated protein